MLEINALTVRRGGVDVVVDLDLSVDGGEIVALLGPSGAGKSSLLLAIAGLVDVATGTVRIGGSDMTDEAPHRRGVGMVFQEYALFPHMDVARNVAYGLHGRSAATGRTGGAGSTIGTGSSGAGTRNGSRDGSVDAVVDAWLARVGLEPERFRHRDVATLSGGQRQRVALARSLAPGPPVLLLDEPLGALDRQLREEMLGEIDEVVRTADGPAVVVVTHDRDEAFTLGDRVGVMRAGRLVQLATPSELWARPIDEWTARFLGHLNVMDPGEAEALGLAPEPIYLPAHAVEVATDGRGRRSRVVAVAWRDGAQRVTVDCDGVALVLAIPSGQGDALATGTPDACMVAVGDELLVSIDLTAATPLSGGDPVTP